MNITPPAVARQFIFGRSVIKPVRVAYSLEETAEAWGIKPEQVSRAIHAGHLPARNNSPRRNGGRYLVAGATILEYGIAEPRIPVNDHREIVQPDVSYTYANLATMFGWDVQAVRRLNYNGLLTPDITNAPCPLFSGALIRAWLEGADEPITYRASA
jgi:hypothetical protein